MGNTYDVALRVAFPLGLKYAGPKRNKEYNLRRGPRPAGPVVPPTPDPIPIPDPPSPSVAELGAVPALFPCPNCERAFTTKIGLGVHRRAAHPAIANEEIDVLRVKARWREEETRLMAREEALAVSRGVLYINQHLLTVVPGRTLEAIKGARRKPAYRSLVAAAMQDIEAASSRGVRSPTTSPGPEAGHPCPSTPTNPALARPASLDVASPGTSLLGQLCADIREAILALIPTVVNIHGWQTTILSRIARDCTEGADVWERLLTWVEFVFPQVGESPRPHRGRHVVRGGRKAKRRAEYARVQRRFRSNMSWAAREILDATGDEEEMVPGVRTMSDHWGPYVSQASKPVPAAPQPRRKPELAHLWHPVSCEEVASTSLPLRSAPGLDGVSVRLWRAVPPSVRALYFNVVLALGGFPPAMLSSRTVFVRKKAGADSPADYRPISITSVIVRHLHKILATRLRASGVIDPRQRCFDDGCGENITALASSIYEARTRLRELHVASLDVAKAYDSVSHHAIARILDDMGVPAQFTAYVTRLYDCSSTMFEVRGERSESYRIGRGVRQGDPLSPVLFCLVVDKVMEAIPDDVGFQLGDCRLSALAYADDILLFAGSEWGMQTALSRVDQKAWEYGLTFNALKCCVLSLVPSGVVKKIKYITTPTFQLGKGASTGVAFIPQVTSDAEWKYLGVDFTPTGPRKVKTDLGLYLDRITRAPLKPQQRLTLLRTFLLPRVYHALVLGRATLGKLRALDLQTRASVRRWLRLPHDTPAGFFHAPVAGGGLGVPALSTTIPGLMRERLLNLGKSRSPQMRAIADSTWVTKRVLWTTKALTRDNRVMSSRYLRGKWWTHRLHASADGYEVREAPESPLSTRWVDTDSRLIPGRDFVQYVHVRINALPTLVRTTRGARRQAQTTGCRAGCLSTETAAHVIQGCFRTHGGRVLRHNAVCNTLAAGLRNIGWTVQQEPVFQTAEGRRKPDLVCVREAEVSVVDAQVVSRVPSLDDSHRRKVSYYAHNSSLVDGIASRYGVRREKVKFSSCTISWRGIWSSASADWLLGMGLTSGLLRGITTRVLQGSHTNWTRWNQMTSYGPPRSTWGREGVG